MHQANAVTTVDHYDAVDSMADWGAAHAGSRAHRPFIPQGCTQQDRLVPSISPAKPLERPVASINASDPADDFRQADSALWICVGTGMVAWGSAIAWAFFR